MLFNIDTVILTVVQPRLEHLSSWAVSKEDLVKWAKEEVEPAAAKAHAGEGDLLAGGHCRWCKALHKCQAVTELANRMAAEEFADPNLVSDSDLLELYNKIPLISAWAKKAHDHILKTALDGKKWEGLKVVEGKSNRIWLNEVKVRQTLKKAGYKAKEYLSFKLQGLGKIEKLVGKEDFKKSYTPLLIKPPGAPTLAPENDKRPALGYESAKEDFKEEIK